MKKLIALAFLGAMVGSALADQLSFMRPLLSPILRGPAFSGMKIMGSGPQTQLLVQPGYGWGDGFTTYGATFEFDRQPDGESDKGLTAYGFNHMRTSPDEDSEVASSLVYLFHRYNSSTEQYWLDVTGFYSTANRFGDTIGGIVTASTPVSIFGDSGFFVVGSSINYAQFTPREGAITRGAAMSVNIARKITQGITMEYDHTFASKFSGDRDYYFRTTFALKDNSQVRFTVSRGENYFLEYGFYFGSK